MQEYIPTTSQNLDIQMYDSNKINQLQQFSSQESIPLELVDVSEVNPDNQATSDEVQEFNEYLYNNDYLSIYTNKCHRSTMEDRVDFRIFEEDESCIYFAVFDGHGSYHVAQFLSQNLYLNIIQNKNYSSDLELAIKQSFQQINEEIQSNSQFNNSGSVVLCGIIKNKTLYIGHLGDSKAVAIQQDETIELTKDHNFESIEEYDRVTKLGGIVIQQKNTKRLNGSLNVSRSLGDNNYKQFISPIPEIIKYELDLKKDKFILFSSDGIFQDCTTKCIGQIARNSQILDLSENIYKEIYNINQHDCRDNVAIICLDVQNYYNKIEENKKKVLSKKEE